MPLGSTVTLVVARAPRWEALSTIEGTEDAEPESLVVPAGTRLVLSTVDSSPLGLFGGRIEVELSGDGEGKAEVDAGETIVLADVSEGDRTFDVEIDADGSVHWTLAVEAPR